MLCGIRNNVFRQHLNRNTININNTYDLFNAKKTKTLLFNHTVNVMLLCVKLLKIAFRMLLQYVVDEMKVNWIELSWIVHQVNWKLYLLVSIIKHDREQINNLCKQIMLFFCFVFFPCMSCGRLHINAITHLSLTYEYVYFHAKYYRDYA